MSDYTFPASEQDRLKRHAPREAPHPLDWAAENIDYSKATSYDTPFKGKFDPDLFPFWREPLQWSIEPGVREIVAKKPSRAGGSETFILTRMRYAVDVKPEPTAYYGADMESVQTFMEDRIKRGMALSDTTNRLFKQARVTEHAIRFPAMDLRVKWARMRSAFKQDGYALIFGDEVSTWQAFAIDMLRKRADMYPFHHILLISSPAPDRKGNPETDPICVAYEATDKQQWTMPDPDKKGMVFAWTFAGLKWPEDAKYGDEWDLDRVRKEAVFVTPHGTTITNDQRMDLTRAGKWKPTAKSDRDDVRGIDIKAPMIPTASGDFGELAARFLSAKYRLRDDGTKEERQHNPIRVYFAEYWAEAYREQQVQVHNDTLSHCEGDYQWKNISVQPDSTHGIFCTSDIQKYHLWWLACVWEITKGGTISSHRLDYGNSASFTDMDAAIGEFEPSLVGVDIGYAGRATEVMDYCAEYTDQMHPRDARVIALRGSDTLQKSVMDIIIRDAYEGRRMSGQSLYCEITWSNDVFREWLIDYIDKGDGTWTVPKGLGNDKKGIEYIRQVTTTKKVDGEWIQPRHRQDHLFDCEVMQLVLARYDQLIR